MVAPSKTLLYLRSNRTLQFYRDGALESIFCLPIIKSTRDTRVHSTSTAHCVSIHRLPSLLWTTAHKNKQTMVPRHTTVTGPCSYAFFSVHVPTKCNYTQYGYSACGTINTYRRAVRGDKGNPV